MPIIAQTKSGQAPDTGAPLSAAELAPLVGVNVARAEDLLAAAWASVERYAPVAPTAVHREAVVRTAGWLAEQPAGAVRSESVGDISTAYAATHTSALRHSGGNGAALSVENAPCWEHRVMPSPRRFPETITRRRQAPGDTDSAGQWVPGAVAETTFRASVQPLKLEDSDIVGGVSLVERLRVYVPEPGALAAAFNDREADQVIYAGTTYVVEESRSWPGSHTRATLLREV